MAKKKAKNLKKGSALRGNAGKEPATKHPAPDQDLKQKSPLLLPPAWDGFLGWICFGGIILLAFLMSFHTLSGVDIFWHLKTGEIIFQTHRAPAQDSYSFTIPGREWIDAQWLFQLVIYLFYRSAGYCGMIIFTAVLAALTWTLILLSGFHPKKYFWAILLTLLSLLAVSGRLRLRPEMFSFFFLALEIFLVQQYRSGKRSALYPIPFLIWLWVNSQGLWPIGLFILLMVLLEEIISRPQFGLQKYFKIPSAPGSKQAILELTVCLAASSALTLLNPYGVSGVIFPVKLIQEISSTSSFIGGYIDEFKSPFQKLNRLSLSAYITLTALSGIFFIFLVFSRRLYPAVLVLWASFLYLSITAVRNVALFAIATAMLMGGILLKNIDQEIFPIKRVYPRLLRLRPLGAAAILLVMIWLSADIISSRLFFRNQLYSRFGIGVGALETDYPIRAGHFLKSILSDLEPAPALKIFADLDSAGYLIWAGYPEWKVYVDPRMEVYGDQFIKKYVSLLGDWQGFKNEDRKYNFDLVVLTSYKVAGRFLLNLYYDPEWALIYLDGNNVVFLKNKPPFSGAVEKYRMALKQKLDSPLPQNLGGTWMALERYYRGALLLTLNHPELALWEFEDGIKYDSKDLNLIFNLGWTLNIARRYREARPYLEQVAKRDPGFIANRIQLARAYAMLGQSDQAIQILQQILSKDPNQIFACIDLAKVYDLIKSERAEGQWKKCYKIYQADPKGYEPEGAEILRALQRFEK